MFEWDCNYLKHVLSWIERVLYLVQPFSVYNSFCTRIAVEAAGG